uniref:Protein-PII uridylyltransferase N-terminal domain-containing protein n=1 Tax=Branchiostoma floridae TaxID=7739 RepID=C3ZRJ6_BRAFL|eukprot:XP_002588785.1 hypothetical protein BRAFLDRAFT_89785 [Branchiostoma floridae]
MRAHGPTRAEPGYLRALLDAVADMDRCAEVEGLKSLGDVNLEEGRLDKDAVKFTRAMSLYVAAIVRCRDPEVGLALEHRHNYAEKQRNKLRLKQIQCQEDTVKSTGDSSPARLAETFEILDKKWTTGGNTESVLVGYTRLMVEGIIADDSTLEAEAIKSIGDVYLKRGIETRDTTCLTKATALYNTALARWEGVQGSVVLVHRLLYTAKIREEVNRNKNKKHNRTEDRRRQQNFQLPRDIMTSHRDDGVTRLHGDSLKIADHALRKGYLDLAEEVFAFALRLIHDPSNPVLSDEACCLSKLGDVYVKRGQLTKEGKKFTQAAALYNAAIARTVDPNSRQSLFEKLQQVERLFLQHVVGLKCQINRCNSNEDHKNQLKAVRAYAKSQLEIIDEKHNPYQYDESDPVVREIEVQRAEAVQELFQYIAKERREFVQGLLEECMEKLGPPPCKYAYIGLGSQATELVTPYSDLEFAILIEEGEDNDVTRRYFLNLTHNLQLKVINLGETILPAMAIPSLNDFYSEDPERDWFFDSVTPRGFAFDGFMPWACKTPFGREQTKSKPPLSLIQTPAQMAQFQRQDVSLAEGYHLSIVLKRAVLLMGDQDLMHEYTDRLRESTATSPDLGLATLLKRSIGETGTYLPQEQLLDVKKEIYRVPSLAIELLRVVFGVESASVWEALVELERRRQVSNENANHLKVLTSISAELRLRTYLSNEGQREQLSVLPGMKTDLEGLDISNSVIDTVFRIPDTKMLFRYYYTAIPLKECILDVFGNGIQAQMAAFLEAVLFDNSHLLRGLIAQKLHKYRESTISLEAAMGTAEGDQEILVSILIALADNCIRYNDFGGVIKHSEQSLKILESIYGDKAHPGIAMSLHNLGLSWSELDDQNKAMDYLQQSHSMTEVNYGSDAANHELASLSYDLGICWSSLGDMKKAMKYHEQSLKIGKSMFGDKAANLYIARSLNSLGQCWSKLGDDRKAINYFEQSLMLDKTMYGHNTVHPSMAMTYHNLGLCWINLGDYGKAARLFKHSLEMLKVVHGDNTVHPTVAKVLDSIGSCCNQLGDLRRAISCHEESLKMKITIYGETTAKGDIAGSLNNLGSAWQNLGDVKKAIGYFEQSLRMLEEIHGDNTPHPDTANTLNNLGTAWDDVGNSIKALSYHEQSLRMKKTLYGHNTPHPDIASSLNNLGSVWSNIGDKRKAISFYEDALKMRIALYGDNTAHPGIASAFSNLGSALRELGDYKQAMTYFERSLKMAKAIYGESTPNPDIARLLNNLGSVCSSLSQHEKAISYHRESLQMRKTIYGDNTPHPDIASSLTNIGSYWSKRGDERKAKTYHEQALGMLKAVYGEETDHPRIASSLCSLGACFCKLGDERKAIKYHEASLRMYKVIYGEGTPHPDIAKSFGHLGDSWSELGDLEKAIHYFEQSLKMKKTIYGDSKDHPDIANSLNSIGAYWSKVGDNKKAICYFEESLKMYKRIHGDNMVHSDIARSLHNLGCSWEEVGDCKKAVGYLEESLRLYKYVYGEQTAHPLIAKGFNNLAVALTRLEEHSKAAGYCTQSLRMRRTIYGENSLHPDIAESLQNLGVCCKNLGEHWKAINYYEQALTMMKSIYGQNTTHPNVAALLCNFALSLSNLGDDRRAINYYEQALAIMKAVYGKNTAHPNVATLLFNLGLSWRKLDDKQRAESYTEQSILMMQEVKREDTADCEFAQALRDVDLLQ